MSALTVTDAAKYLQVSEWTVRFLARKGKLTGCKIGKSGWRFSIAALESLLLNNEIKEESCQSSNVVPFITPDLQPQTDKGYLNRAKQRIKNKRKSTTTS